jgi:exodeoxyribonuclease VII large subunit
MSQIPLNLDLVPSRKIYSVSELNASIRDLLESEFQDIWVEGEISNFREAPSGHYYFSLKDERAQLRCVCFKQNVRYLRFRPEDGLQATARGQVSIYEARGEYQLYVEYLEPLGYGALQLAFEQLKARLAEEGLFDPAHKKPLPRLPRRVGLLTSPRGAVIQDMIRILERRFPDMPLLLYPVSVQGEGSADEIAEGLRYFNHTRAVDVIIVARGGGSIEDLWSFNEEKVARAIYASKIPVVTGVGHETDFTIADFVADVRAPTPSAAAELVVESKEQLQAEIAGLEKSLLAAMRHRLLEWRQFVQALATHRGFRQLEILVRDHSQKFDDLVMRLTTSLTEHVRRERHRLEVARARFAAFDWRGWLERLHLRLDRQRNDLIRFIEAALVRLRRHLEAAQMALEERSPLRILERGYAICYDAAGNVVRAAAGVALGEEITVQLARGRLGAEVKRRQT